MKEYEVSLSWSHRRPDWIEKVNLAYRIGSESAEGAWQTVKHELAVEYEIEDIEYADEIEEVDWDDRLLIPESRGVRIVRYDCDRLM